MSGQSQTVRKLGNALVPNARPLLIPSAFEGFRKMIGGLWIGGTVTLTDADIAFRANVMNRALHTGVTSPRIPLAQVTRVADRYGVFTRIIDVEGSDGSVLTFRCFGAQAFARVIAERVRRARGL